MKLSSIILVFALASLTVHGQVVINNAGFESPAHTRNDGTNPNSWTVFETTSGTNPARQVRTRDNQQNSGLMSVQLGAGQSNHIGELYQTVTTVIGQEYTFSIWGASAFNFTTADGVKDSALQNFTVDLLAGTGAAGAPTTGPSLVGNSLAVLASVNDGGSLSTTWQEFTVNFTATSVDTTIWIRDTSAAISADENGISLDDVSIIAIPEPTTYAMLLGGLGLMYALRRR